MSDFEELIVYKKAFRLSMEIFRISRFFPKEESYSRTDQILRSSRSVCANISEAYRKRRYPNHFISKMSDADMENAETKTWLNFTLACDYINPSVYEKLKAINEEIGKLIGYMMKNPHKFVKH